MSNIEFDYQDRMLPKKIELESCDKLLFQPTCPFCLDALATWKWADDVLTCGTCGHESILLKNGQKILIVGLKSSADCKLLNATNKEQS
jgi:hypothetical protein